MSNPSSSKSFPLNNYLLIIATTCLCVWIVFLWQNTQGRSFDSKLFTKDRQQTFSTQLELLPLTTQAPQGVIEIIEIAKRVTINISLTNTPLGIIQPVIIKKGTCTEQGDVLYQLAPTVDGKSSTTYYGLSRQDLQNNLPLAIFTLSSTTDNTHTGCAQVKL